MYQMAIAAMYVAVRDPMRREFAAVQAEIDGANHRLSDAMIQLKV